MKPGGVFDRIEEYGVAMDLSGMMKKLGFKGGSSEISGGTKGQHNHFKKGNIIVDVRYYPEHKGKSGNRVGAVYDWWVKKGGKKYHGTHLSALRDFLGGKGNNYERNHDDKDD